MSLNMETNLNELSAINPKKVESVYSAKFIDENNYFKNLSMELKILANKRNTMNGLDLLNKFQNSSVPAVFFDPQYRGVMDKLEYGNEGSRQKGRASLSQMTDVNIKNFINEIDRVLKPSGHLLLWVDKFHLVEGVAEWIKNTSLEVVDLVTWDKGRIGMGYRTRRKSEYLMIYQKTPKRAKGCWTTHDIPDVWSEKVAKVHPHAKPEQLQAALINSIVSEGDFIVDPASGGFSVMRSARSIGRHFIGADLIG